MLFRGLLAAVAALTVGAGAARATTFTFQFTDLFTGTPTVVGSGTFSTSATLTPGQYDLTSLPDFSISYSFVDGSVFTQSNIATPLDGVALNVLPYGSSALAMQWTEVPGSPDADGGPSGGALDLVVGDPTGSGSGLGFEPSFAGGNTEFIEASGQGSSLFFGDYLATTGGVPEPATWALMILGLGAVGFSLRRRGALALA